MKFCTYCGAELNEGAAVFCPECGKSLGAAANNTRQEMKKPEQAPRNTGNNTIRRLPPETHSSRGKKRKPPRISQIQKKKPPFKKKPELPVRPKSKMNKAPRPEYTPVKNPMDENYDGYYNDRLTDDNGQNKETMEPELIKRIVLISAGFVVLVVLSIVIMYLL